jgi:hypothetical protein
MAWLKMGKKALTNYLLINNMRPLYAEIAQSVEHRTENPGVPSSILGLGTIWFIKVSSFGERPWFRPGALFRLSSTPPRPLRLSGGNSKDKNPEVNKEVNNVMNRPWKVRVFSRVELS